MGRRCVATPDTEILLSELVFLELTPRLCLRFVLCDIRLNNIFTTAMSCVMNYSLLMPNLVAFYAKMNEIYKHEFRFAFNLEVSFSNMI